MPQNNWYPYFQPPNNFFGRLSVALAILGRGGKFGTNYQQYQPVSQQPFLIDTNPGSLMNVAMQVPHLNTVISTGAELFSLMEIKHLDKDGEEIKDSPVLKFLKKPNPLQTLSQYLYEFYVLNAVYNKTFQYKITPLKFEPKSVRAMWLLPSGWMKINPTGKRFRQTELKDIIQSYEMLNGEGYETFEVDKVIYMTEGIGGDVLNPISRIDALKIPLSNIMACLKSFNIIVSEKGMIGFLAPDGGSKDGDGFLPYDSKEAERFRNEYQRTYHLDSTQGHVNMTTNNTKWVPMSFPVNDLQLFPGIEDALAAICGAYRHDRDIYPSIKGATFENKAAGMRSTIQNGLQPLADKLCEQLTAHLIEDETGEKLSACYEHLPSMKEDELKKEQAEETKVRRLSSLYKDGIITDEQYAVLANVEFEPSANRPQNASQSNLRGLVGSVTGIIQVNQFVATGFIDKPTAQNILMTVYGFDKNTAASMITHLTVEAGTVAPSTTLPKE